MGVLHLVNRSPGESLALAQCLERVGPNDAVLLLEGGVYAVLKDSLLASKLASTIEHASIHALGPDLRARGIAAEEVMAGVILVDYEGFVELSVMHNPIISWG